MRRTKHYRPSSAMAVAITALVFATTGVAGAATGILPNPLPLQNPPPSPVTVVRTASGSGLVVHAQCKTGERLTGGGAAIGSGSTKLAQSVPVGPGGSLLSDGQTPTGWGGIATDANNFPSSVFVWAVCESP
jgi:hypothetical protein